MVSEQIESATPPPAEPPSRPADGLVEADLLVEDVSIDGMCGVY
ncbi:MAG: mycofactocin precursor MftA [Solirubrobacteraceae bacterium]